MACARRVRQMARIYKLGKRASKKDQFTLLCWCRRKKAKSFAERLPASTHTGKIRRAALLLSMAKHAQAAAELGQLQRSRT